MCGIIGIHQSRHPIDRKNIDAAARTLAHRGPDGAGVYISPDRRHALAHRRLSIIDLQTGGQPLFSEDGQIAAVVNGEFYGHADIRRQLETRGHVFATKSDSEILIHLYEEYGTDCLQYLRGEFAFILTDRRKNITFAACDRFGIKPLCYTRLADGTLLLASEAKALFSLGAAAAWDMDSFYSAASMQYALPGRTMFRGVHQLRPGERLVASGPDLQTGFYWEMDFIPESETSLQDENEAAAAVETALTDALRERLCADVPVCFHLSGGLDSSGLLGLATHMTGKPQQAFTVRFNHGIYDEYPIAHQTAAAMGAQLHTVDVSQDDLVTYLPEAVYHAEGLSINGHLAGKYLLNRAIRAAGFKVALSGEGSDEIFSGYPHLRQDLWHYESANDSAATQAEAALYAGNAASTGIQIAYGSGLPTEAVTQALGYMPAFLAAKATLGLRLHGLLAAPFRARFAGYDAYAALMQQSGAAEKTRGWHPVNRSAWLWSKTALAGYILRTLGDGMDMAHSVEGRLPFLDHKLFAAVRQIPVRLKIRGGTEKYILRKALKPYITQTVHDRQKHPFMAPPVSLFTNPRLGEMLSDHLLSRSFADMNFFDTAAARALPDRLKAMTDTERTAQEPALMMMLSAHMLHTKFGLSA